MQSLIVPKLSDNSQRSKSVQVYCNILNVFNEPINKPHKFVKSMLQIYNDNSAAEDRSVHGKFFEYVIGEALAINGISPLYYQTELAHVPLAVFDWFLYHPVKPVSISCKTKSRDRWKQAAYEGMSLKRVYFQATNYLITIEPVTATESKSIDAPQTIDGYIQANQPEFDEMIKKISSQEFYKAEPVSPIIKGHILEV